MTATTKLSTVQAAIASVIADLPAIGKDGTAPANMGGYKYRGIEQITAALQPLMAKHGLVIVPQARSMTVVHSPDQKPAWQDVTIQFDWLIVGPDGSTLTASTYGIGRDHTDKGANKAQSQAFKYLLLGLFCISDPKDDGDGHDYYTRAAESAPAMTPDEVAGDELSAHLAVEVKSDPTLGPKLRALGASSGRGFSGEALTDPIWRLEVREALDAHIARREQDRAAEGPTAALETNPVVTAIAEVQAEAGRVHEPNCALPAAHEGPCEESF